MQAVTPPATEFARADIAATLVVTQDADLDSLDFGVVEMDLSGKVLRYNATESRFSGLAAARVVGRRFFTEVAPCSDNAMVAHRFNQPVVDETVRYTFALKMKPVPVTLRMVKAVGIPRMYLLVRWS